MIFYMLFLGGAKISIFNEQNESHIGQLSHVCRNSINNRGKPFSTSLHSFLIELLYLLYHVLDILVYL